MTVVQHGAVSDIGHVGVRRLLHMPDHEQSPTPTTMSQTSYTNHLTVPRVEVPSDDVAMGASDPAIGDAPLAPLSENPSAAHGQDHQSSRKNCEAGDRNHAALNSGNGQCLGLSTRGPGSEQTSSPS